MTSHPLIGLKRGLGAPPPERTITHDELCALMQVCARVLLSGRGCSTDGRQAIQRAMSVISAEDRHAYPATEVSVALCRYPTQLGLPAHPVSMDVFDVWQAFVGWAADSGRSAAQLREALQAGMIAYVLIEAFDAASPDGLRPGHRQWAADNGLPWPT
jgi:hypothetical protein